MSASSSLILASSSPRRQDLLRRLNIDFSIHPAKSDGPILSDDPELRVAGHALFKAREVAAQHARSWVLAGDTLVYGDGEFFTKPDDSAHARYMLQRLQAMGEHRVYTASCLLNSESTVFQLVEYAVVSFQNIPESDIASYLNGTEWSDKAGAYAIQGWAGQFASCIAGDFETIVGMSEVTVKKLFAMSGFQFSGE